MFILFFALYIIIIAQISVPKEQFPDFRKISYDAFDLFHEITNWKEISFHTSLIFTSRVSFGRSSHVILTQRRFQKFDAPRRRGIDQLPWLLAILTNVSSRITRGPGNTREISTRGSSGRVGRGRGTRSPNGLRIYRRKKRGGRVPCRPLSRTRCGKRRVRIRLIVDDEWQPENLNGRTARNAPENSLGVENESSPLASGTNSGGRGCATATRCDSREARIGTARNGSRFAHPAGCVSASACAERSSRSSLTSLSRFPRRTVKRRLTSAPDSGAGILTGVLRRGRRRLAGAAPATTEARGADSPPRIQLAAPRWPTSRLSVSGAFTRRRDSRPAD